MPAVLVVFFFSVIYRLSLPRIEVASGKGTYLLSKLKAIYRCPTRTKFVKLWWIKEKNI